MGLAGPAGHPGGAAGSAPSGALPPSAGLRSEPEVPLRPDFSERLGRRLARFGDRRPRLARRAARAYALTSWLALAVLVASLVAVPDLRVAPAVGFGLLVLVAQLAAVSRSRTVSFAGCARVMVVAAVLAVPIGLAEAVAAASLGLAVDAPAAVVYLAGPIEELLKLTPLLLLALCARHRVRRFAVVDFALIGAAAGAGLQLAEDAARRISAPPGALVGPLDMAVGIQYAWTQLLPGGVEWGLVRFPGHAVLTGLVGLGVGFAVRLRPRYGRVVWLVPAGCYLLAVLDHIGWANAVHEPFAGDVLAWPLRTAHAVFGAGHGTRWLLLVLVLVAVVLDFRAMRTFGESLPPLPGAPPWPGAVERADVAAGRIRRAVPDYAAAVFHRLAGAVGAAVIAAVDAAVQVLHEGAVIGTAARRGPMTFFSCLRFLRERRELAQAVHHAAGRPRRDVPPRDGLRRRSALLESTLLGEPAGGAPATAAVAVAGLACAGVAGGVLGLGHASPGPAFVATVADELLTWWAGLAPASRFVVPFGVAGLVMVLGGIWSLPAGSPEAGGRSGFLRDPRGATKEFLTSRTPGQVGYYAAARGLGLVVPEGLRRVLERPRGDAGSPSRPSSRVTFPPEQLRKRYAHCASLFGLPATYTAGHGQRLRQALREFIDSPETVRVASVRYRGEPAVIHYDPRRRIAVVFRPDGRFRSGWRLTAAQYYDLVNLGAL